MKQRPRILFSVVVALGLAMFLWFGFITIVSAQQAPDPAIQDKAVVRDQIRQDKAAAETRTEVASALAIKAAATTTRQDANAAMNFAKIEAIEEQDTTDRQIIFYMGLAMTGMLLAVWLMVRTAVRSLAEGLKKVLLVKQATLDAVNDLNGLAGILATRTELLEAHIAVTTPEVLEAYRAKLAAQKSDA